MRGHWLQVPLLSILPKRDVLRLRTFPLPSRVIRNARVTCLFFVRQCFGMLEWWAHAPLLSLPPSWRRSVKFWHLLPIRQSQSDHWDQGVIYRGAYGAYSGSTEGNVCREHSGWWSGSTGVLVDGSSHPLSLFLNWPHMIQPCPFSQCSEQSETEASLLSSTRRVWESQMFNLFSLLWEKLGTEHSLPEPCQLTG